MTTSSRPERLPIHPVTPEGRKVTRAVELLRRGGVIAYPTDTVYGIGCNLFDKRAVERVYKVKQMPRDKPLAILCPDLADIARYALVTNDAYRIMRRLVPGPYTFVLAATKDVPKMVLHKQRTVGIRVPDHPVPQALLRALGSPLISTSASLEGEVVSDPEDVAARFPVDLVLDAGPSGLEPSTVLALREDGIEVLREGKGRAP